VRRLRATKPLLATDDRLLYIVDSMSYIEGYNSNSLETLFEQRYTAPISIDNGKSLLITYCHRIFL
jgi:hypothetical protein